ncbi:MAG: CPBP family intramembrane glutamic endopeptidase, partial [Promethearchaeota archaeon]
SMYVYTIMDIDISGEAILASLPVDRRSQAKAKLLLLMILQTLAVIFPCLIYIRDPKFSILLYSSIFSLPIILLFLFLTFQLRIYFFGQKKYPNGKNIYLINEFNLQNKAVKWVFIVIAQYLLSFILISVALTLFLQQQFQVFFFFYVMTLIIGFICLIISFNKMFPILPDSKKRNIKTRNSKKIIKIKPKIIFKGKITIFTENSGISITISSILFLVITIWSDWLLLLYILTYLNISYDIISISTLFFYNLPFIGLIFLVIPKILGIPNGRIPLKKYLKNIKLGSLTLYAFIFLFVLISISISFLPFYFNNIILWWAIIVSKIFWNELFFRGIILTLLQKYNKQYLVILLNALISLLFSIILVWLFFLLEFYELFKLVIIVYPIYIFGISIFLTYLSIKANNILPCILIRVILNTIFLPITFVFWIIM